MTRSNNNPKDLESFIAQTLHDVKNPECQIRSLLQSMDVVNDISDVPTLPLPEREKCEDNDDDEKRPETRMQWRSSDYSKMERKGKTNVKSKEPQMRESGKNVQDLSSLDILDMCVNESNQKYIPVEDSVFFVPVLNRCIFGVTLLNAADTKLKKPTVSLSLLQASEKQSQRKSISRCFLYDVLISLKYSNLEKVDLPKTEQGLTCQGSFSNYLDMSNNVMPGCEVLVTATFAYPSQFMTANHYFSILLSVYLEGKELWAREIPVSSTNFTATTVDEVFKKHHVNILTAISTQHEIFKIERLLSQSEMSPHRAIQRFMLPLGFEKIHSLRTGTDTTVEIYSTHQPSLLWGTCIKIEKCSTKASSVRCIFTSRTKEQMSFLFSQLQVWLKKEGQKERKLGWRGIEISPINLQNNLSICERLQAEIGLIERLLQVKSILKKEKEMGCTQKRRIDKLNQIGSIDSCWIHEYSTCVELTDTIFVAKMN